MVSPARLDRLRQVLERLPEGDQDRVIRFAEDLSSSELPAGTPWSELQEFFGCVSEEYADRLEREIEEAFEQVDPNEWKDPA
ncbi:MAG: hypothetical protein ACOC1G_03025 [Phycisphaeraceae bacterium]